MLERFAAQSLNDTVQKTELAAAGEATATHQPSALSKMADTFGELDMVLTGLNLPHMLPIFQKHQVI